MRRRQRQRRRLGGRLRSGSGTLLLWGSLFWNRLYLGKRGGIVDVIVGGSVVGGDVFGSVVDEVIVNFLFVGGDFLVKKKDNGRGRKRCNVRGCKQAKKLTIINASFYLHLRCIMRRYT